MISDLRNGMSERKHTEAQIIAALKQVEAGRTAEAEARECGLSKHTIYANLVPTPGWPQSSG